MRSYCEPVLLTRCLTTAFAPFLSLLYCSPLTGPSCRPNSEGDLPMASTKRLWIGLGLLLAASFAVLLWMGREVYVHAPPLPESIVTTAGEELYSRRDLETGRQVWQSTGGQQLGSIWGHGALIAPDWSADWLHREAEALLDMWAGRLGAVDFALLPLGQQESLKAQLRQEMRRNSYDAVTRVLTVSADRGQAIRLVAQHYIQLFGDDPDLAALRATYAMRDGTVASAEHRRQLTGFFLWTAWATVTERPGSSASYTSNWPYEPLVGNAPTPGTFLWTVFSVLFMMAGIGLLAWHYAAYHGKEPALVPPTAIRRAQGHGIDAGDAEVLLDRRRPVPRADPAGRHHRALPGGEAVLRRGDLDSGRFADADVAYRTRGVVDCDGVARDRPVHRAGHLGP